MNKSKLTFQKATNSKALLAIIIIMVIMIFPKTNFYTTYNFIDILNSSAVNMILGFGVTIVVIAGGSDLSIGGTLSLSGIVTIKLMDKIGLVPAIIVSILLGAFIGFINGFLVVHQKTEPFIITLGMGLFLTGISQEITDGRSIAGTKETFQKISNTKLVFGVTSLVLIMLLMLLLTHFLMRYTQFGNNCYAIGGNYEVALYSGIDVIKTKWMTFVLCGMIAAFAGVLQSAKLNSGSYVYGEPVAMLINCGVVIGGVSFAGGIGNIPKAAIGLLMIGVLQGAMFMLNIQSYVQTLITGLVVILVIWLDSYELKVKRETV